MQAEEIIYTALENLKTNTQIKGKWKPLAKKEIDGQLTLTIGKQKITYDAELKKELRTHHVQKLIAKYKSHTPLIIVAMHLFPKIKEELRNNNVAYLEANGNIYLKNDETTIWIDNNKPIEATKKTSNRAFTKTGLKVVFQFLLDSSLVNKPYRQIAEQTGTGIGNITNIIKGLIQDGFLLPVIKKDYRLHNKKDLLQKWIENYEHNLKPNIKIGTFRFLKAEEFTSWKNMPLLKGETYWGGEPAGDILTDYLRPAELTLYSTEKRNELIKKYRLIPDDKGNIKVYQKFWHSIEVSNNVVPPLLVYADLINKNDRRCSETAQKIYNEFLQNKF